MHGGIALANQLNDLQAEQAQHGGDPAVGGKETNRLAGRSIETPMIWLMVSFQSSASDFCAAQAGFDVSQKAASYSLGNRSKRTRDQKKGRPYSAPLHSQ
jgi:hypothetical protein